MLISLTIHIGHIITISLFPLPLFLQFIDLSILLGCDYCDSVKGKLKGIHYKTVISFILPVRTKVTSFTRAKLIHLKTTSYVGLTCRRRKETGLYPCRCNQLDDPLPYTPTTIQNLKISIMMVCIILKDKESSNSVYMAMVFFMQAIFLSYLLFVCLLLFPL